MQPPHQHIPNTSTYIPPPNGIPPMYMANQYVSYTGMNTNTNSNVNNSTNMGIPLSMNPQLSQQPYPEFYHQNQHFGNQPQSFPSFPHPPPPPPPNGSFISPNMNHYQPLMQHQNPPNTQAQQVIHSPQLQHVNYPVMNVGQQQQLLQHQQREQQQKYQQQIQMRQHHQHHQHQQQQQQQQVEQREHRKQLSQQQKQVSQQLPQSSTHQQQAGLQSQNVSFKHSSPNMSKSKLSHISWHNEDASNQEDKRLKKRGRKKKMMDDSISTDTSTKGTITAKIDTKSYQKPINEQDVQFSSGNEWKWKNQKLEDHTVHQRQKSAIENLEKSNIEGSKTNNAQKSSNDCQNVFEKKEKSWSRGLNKNLSFNKVDASNEPVEMVGPFEKNTSFPITAQQMSPDADIASGRLVVNYSNNSQQNLNSQINSIQQNNPDQDQSKRKVFEVNMLLNSNNVSPFASNNEKPSKLVSLRVNYGKCTDSNFKIDTPEKNFDNNNLEKITQIEHSNEHKRLYQEQYLTSESSSTSSVSFTNDSDTDYIPNIDQDYSSSKKDESMISKHKKVPGAGTFVEQNKKGRKRKYSSQDGPDVTNKLITHDKDESYSLGRETINYPTLEENNIMPTHEQIQQIVRTNNLVNSSIGPKIEHDKVLPPLMELMNGSLPQIPHGYVPLVMAPDGKLIPMELLRVNPEENSISIMRPIWDSDFGVYNSNTDIVFEPLSMEFTEDDRNASIQLRLMSKEPVTYINEHMISLPKNKIYVDYYNRLLELEEIKLYDTYKVERNRYQDLLNQLENGDQLLNEEKDLMERRDYLLLREDIGTEYLEGQIKNETASVIDEIESMAILEYTTRLAKLKNFLIMENERIKKNTSKLCRINNNKSHSIWRKYVKSNAFKRKSDNSNSTNGESNTSSNNHNLDELIYNLVSPHDFLQLTDFNSRLYATYVLNNSSNKGIKGQREVLEILEYFLPDDSILRKLYKEVKRIKRTNEDIKSSKELKKKDLISAYGLKSTGNVKGSKSRLLRQLQIDGMTVDVSSVDSDRRNVNVVPSKRKRSNNTLNKNFDSDSVAYSDRDSSATERVNKRGGTSSTRFTEPNNKIDLGSSQTETKVSRKDVHLVSCLDPSILESDRVKMMNLNSEEIRSSFTRVYGMPKGLSYEEIEDDILAIRQYNDEL
ncbi:hypothetical protein CANINC_004631 [Pichia inconspicua]|uniref:Uncharacterized protein n=1 Tax=Pichia inconspicua TaxID=52247 RepID=A0A4T0WXC0_9ASCO|nr:hypothetical protein CANINC_004631 [[Candida] inconspicua]